MGLTCAAIIATVAQAIEVPKTTKDVAAGVNWLCSEGRFDEAHEVTSAWLSSHPDDAAILGSEAYMLAVQATTLGDGKAATLMRRQAHAEAQRARQLGNNDAILDMVLSQIDADGRDLTDLQSYSPVPAAAAAVKQGEQAFARHDLAAALGCYQRALTLDPRSYSAALFAGDVYFSQRKYDQAIEWFGKAIAIDPNRETAHRYLGDTYAKLEKWKQARSAYIDAVIAMPYQRIPREMIARIAPGRKIHVPEVPIPLLEVTLTEKGPNISLDPDGGPLLLIYALARTQWLMDERTKYFPKDTAPRHSLYEECAGLRMLVTAAKEAKNDAETQKLRPAVESIRRLDKAGLLEAFVLLDRADTGIAEDYAAYRQLHREQLVAYISDVWLAPQSPAAEESRTKTPLPAPGK